MWTWHVKERRCKARLQNVARASIKVTMWGRVTSKALHSSHQTFPKHTGNISARGSAVAALWERCMSVVGKFSQGCLKEQRDRLCYFSSASHRSHCLPLSCSCQSHFGRASGGLTEPPHTPFPSGSLYTKTHMLKQTPIPNLSSNLPLWSSIWLSRFGAIGEHSLALLRRFLNTYSQLILQTHTHTLKTRTG